MTMRLFAASALGLLALSCGGGDSNSNDSNIPQAEACNVASQAACAKVFSCPSSDIVIGIVQNGLGGTEQACRDMVRQTYCSAFQCTAGQTYHGDKAAQCRNEFTNVTCTALSASAAAALSGGISGFLASIPGCNQICTATAATSNASGG